MTGFRACVAGPGIPGVQRRTFRDQVPATIEAAELVGRMHDALADAGHRVHDPERFLVRAVSCMFADDTGVFEERKLRQGCTVGR